MLTKQHDEVQIQLENKNDWSRPGPGIKSRPRPCRTQVLGLIKYGPGPQVHLIRLTGPRTETGPRPTLPTLDRVHQLGEEIRQLHSEKNELILQITRKDISLAESKDKLATKSIERDKSPPIQVENIGEEFFLSSNELI